MPQYRLNAYDADVWIPEFKGLMQYGDQMGTDLRYSPDCMNVETPGGVLQPAPLLTGLELYDEDNYPFIAAFNGTAMCLTALYPHCYHSGGTLVTDGGGSGSNSQAASNLPSLEYPWFYVEENVYIYNIDGIFYRGFNSAKYPNEVTESLELVDFDSSVPSIDEFPSVGWSWCTYQDKLGSALTITDDDGSESLSITLPATTVTTTLLFSHPEVGLFQYNHLTKKIKYITTPAKFAYIARYSERIWGVGAGVENKDRIYYSRAYSVTNWTANTTTPSTGGGEIQEPTFDDDEFTGLKQFGDSLIAFMKKRAWKISGTDPSNFMIQEQFGNGTSYPDSVVVFDDRIIMLGDKSFVSYDGSQTEPFYPEMPHELLRLIKDSGYDYAPLAVRVHDKYVMTIKCGENESKAKYRLFIFSMTDKSLTQMDCPQVLSFLDQQDYALICVQVPVYDPVTDDYLDEAHLHIAPLDFDSWYNQQITSEATKWVSPWITFGRQDIKKGGFDLYFTPELAKEKRYTISPTGYQANVTTNYIAGPVTFKISIQTESKLKEKTYTVQPLTDAQVAAGKQYKQKRLHFGGSGRRFRIIIETAKGNTVPWRLVGGIHIIAEIDKD